jgi:two-component system, OmpR family, sensor kinase
VSDRVRGRDLAASTLERLLALEATDVDSALEQAAQLVAEALNADKVDAFIYDPSIHSLVARGTSDTPMGRKQTALGLNLLQVANGGRTVEVFQTGRPFHTGRADEDGTVLRGVVQELGVRSMLAVPLVIAGELRGVLEAVSATPDFFSQAEIGFLEAVGRWVGLVAYRAELVERKAAEAAEQARRMAADELIVVLAHDLRNYLTPIKGRLDMIERRASRESREADVRDAASASRAVVRLDRLITDLLDVTRLEQGLLTLDRKLVGLVPLVQSTAEAFRAPGREIHVETPPELLVPADAERVRQLLENLVTNAVQHSPTETPVALEVCTRNGSNGQRAVVTVTDRGPGIPPELLPNIFDRFVSGAAPRAWVSACTSPGESRPPTGATSPSSRRPAGPASP